MAPRLFSRCLTFDTCLVSRADRTLSVRHISVVLGRRRLIRVPLLRFISPLIRGLFYHRSAAALWGCIATLGLLPVEAQVANEKANYRPRGELRQLAIITCPDSQMDGGQSFGVGLAMSGTTLVIGAPNRTGTNGQLYAGEGYVYQAPPDGWGRGKPVLAARLTASDAQTQTWPELGSVVAISGDTIVLGAAYTSPGTFTREAYVYVKPASGWATATESARLQSPSARFVLGGNGAVAIYRDIIVAECIDTAYTGAGTAGCVAVYQKPAQGWVGDIMPIALLTDGGGPDTLGWQLAIERDTIVASAPEALPGPGGIGASGALEIYEKPANGWQTTATPTATLVTSDSSGGYMGYYIGFSGDTIVAGAPEALAKRQYNGAAYVFQRKGDHWRSGTETAKLTAPAPIIQSVGLAMGDAVAVLGDVIVAGADEDTPPDGATYGGEAFTYRKPASGWQNTSHYDGLAYDPNAYPALELGISAAIDGDTLAAGAWAVDPNNSRTAGAVYLFRLP
jgi:hypothetical protein